jgi:hypothetical protein
MLPLRARRNLFIHQMTTWGNSGPHILIFAPTHSEILATWTGLSRNNRVVFVPFCPIYNFYYKIHVSHFSSWVGQKQYPAMRASSANVSRLSRTKFELEVHYSPIVREWSAQLARKERAPRDGPPLSVHSWAKETPVPRATWSMYM